MSNHAAAEKTKNHKARHLMLHGALDEILTDYLIHHADKRLSQITVFELAEWSYSQTLEPTEKEKPHE